MSAAARTTALLFVGKAVVGTAWGLTELLAGFGVSLHLRMLAGLAFVAGLAVYLRTLVLDKVTLRWSKTAALLLSLCTLVWLASHATTHPSALSLRHALGIPVLAASLWMVKTLRSTHG